MQKCWRLKSYNQKTLSRTWNFNSSIRKELNWIRSCDERKKYSETSISESCKFRLSVHLQWIDWPVLNKISYKVEHSPKVKKLCKTDKRNPWLQIPIITALSLETFPRK